MKKKYKNTQNVIEVLLFSIIAIGILFALIFMNTRFIDKQELHNTIIKVIEHNGDLKAIKQIFNNKKEISPIKAIFRGKDLYYKSDVLISTVLEDVRLSMYLENKLEKIDNIDKIIKEYQEINPFDKLENNQRDYFENIRIKTGKDYGSVSSDINKIVEELYKQNQLVDEYLADSKKSFWISIIAVILSVSIGIYQIISSRPSIVKKHFKDIIENNAPTSE